MNTNDLFKKLLFVHFFALKPSALVRLVVMELELPRLEFTST